MYKIYGEIKYNKDKKEIKISNIGKLETGDLLFGCLKNKENRKDIIGKFGEGMKLAALTFSRLNKKFILKSYGKIWAFFHRKDNRFIKNKEVQTCLFWKEEKDSEYSGNSLNNSVEIIISDFSPEEWLEERDKYLWLNKREILKLAAYSDDSRIKESIGEIILGEFFKRKLYVKDSFVETTNDTTDCSIYFGFNIDLEIDRDRKCVIKVDERNKCIRKIIAYILNNFKNIRNYLSKKDSILLDKFLKGVNHCLKHSFQFIYELYLDIKSEDADVLWDYLIKKESSYKNKYPICNCNSVEAFISEKKLKKEFYPYFKVSYPFSMVLNKSNNYISIESKYNDYCENAKAKENSNFEYNDPLEEIKIVLNKFKNNNNYEIKFINFKDEVEEQSKNNCFKDEKENIFYFSNKLLQEPINKDWKCNILGRCLEILSIPYKQIILLSNIFD